MDRRPRVMFADDHPELLTEHVEALQAAGYRVEVSGDGASLLEEALSHRVDLIVLDVSMPQVGGVEACRCLKAMPQTRKTPVIITADRRDPAAASLKERMQGSVRILRKPFTPQELVEAVRALVRPRLLLSR